MFGEQNKSTQIPGHPSLEEIFFRRGLNPTPILQGKNWLVDLKKRVVYMFHTMSGVCTAEL